MHTIYGYITDNGILGDKHRAELKAKRGFSDETILSCRFFSGGDYLLKIEPSIVERFSREKLLQSGVCNELSGKLVLSDQLTSDGIIIPYIDKENRVVLLRAHKFGFKNVPIQVYQERNIAGRGLILTEGEFKAAAGCQMGLPTIAVPGISSFSKEHFAALVSMLNKHEVKNVCVIYDNEVKDDPRYKSYKEKPSDRYDTTYYAYLMAKKLSEEAFNSRVGVLPDGWRVDGKIDIDGALAQGKTGADLARVVDLSKTHKEYLEELPTESRSVVLKKREISYFRSHVRVDFGHYVSIHKTRGGEIPQTISNFTLKIIATHETLDGMMRSIVLKNEVGETSRSAMLSPEDMSTITFKTFCFSRGNFIWEGTQDDLNAIWRHEFLFDEGKHIVEPGCVGWQEEEQMWLFGNVAVKSGKEMRPDESNIFWTEKKGYKPIPLSEDSSVPYLSVKAPPLDEILSNLGHTIGVEEAKLSLGWIMSIAFLEDVFKLYNCFPFLFLTGKKGSGKSHIADWLMCFWGLERSGKQASDSTTIGLQRCLEYYSSMPVFIDEYKNTQKITQKNGFFRNCYNRQSASKGIKSDFGVRTAKIRGTLLIAGEETPEDPALLSRCISVLITMKRRKQNHYDWFQSKSHEFSAHIVDILKGHSLRAETFKKSLFEAREYFRGIGMDDRMSMNYSVPVAGYCVAYNDKDLSFAKWLKTELSRAKADQDADNVIDIFLNDLQVMKLNKKIDSRYWDVRDGVIYLYFHGLYNAWAEDYRKRKGEPPFKASSIRDYLSDEVGFLERFSSHRFKHNKSNGIAFTHDQAPEGLRQLIEDVSEMTSDMSENNLTTSDNLNLYE